MNTTEQTSSLPSAGGENGVKLLLKYFPDLTEEQRKQFAALYELYIDWNSKINVISRKDIENLYEHHVLHSLGIARIIRFRAGSSVMDLGTGGGFPGIPLAILFPDTKFHLVDALPNGLICLKGGELEHEAMPFKHKTSMHNLNEDFDEEFFQTKKVVYVTI